MRTSSIASVIAVFFIGTLSAQSPTPLPAPAPAFQIAAVDVSTPRAQRRAPAFRGNRFDARGQTLANLITFAYGVNDNRVVGPNWLDVDRFDVAARAPSGTSVEQQRLMMQTLLADRFKLAIRNDSRSQEAWALVVGKGTLQLKRAEASDFTGCRGVPQAPGATAVIQEQDCRNVTLAVVAQRLQGLSSGYFTGPVADATGLTGTWDVRIAVTPSSARAAAGDGISVFDAAERMGLRLERRDTSVPVLVVDRAVRTPTPNAPGATAALAAETTAPDFELVSVRPVAPGTNAPSGSNIQPSGRVMLRNMTIRNLIAFAWEVPADMVVGGPAFVDNDRFEVIADVPASVPRPVDPDLVRRMVRRLLASRFGLAVHEDLPGGRIRADRETRDQDGRGQRRGTGRMCVDARADPAEHRPVSRNHLHEHDDGGARGSDAGHGAELHQ